MDDIGVVFNVLGRVLHWIGVFMMFYIKTLLCHWGLHFRPSFKEDEQLHDSLSKHRYLFSRCRMCDRLFTKVLKRG